MLTAYGAGGRGEANGSDPVSVVAPCVEGIKEKKYWTPYDEVGRVGSPYVEGNW